MSRRGPSSSSGASAFSASIARRAWSRSRTSGASLPNASEASSELVCASRSETFARRSSSTSCSGVGCSGAGSAGDSLTRSHLLREDLLHRRALLVPRDLALGRVSLRDREPRRGPDLLGYREHPLDETLEPGARRHLLTALEVDQAPRETPADRAPEILLQQAMRPRGQRLPLVERTRDAGGQRVAEGGERARLGELGLRVADADLDSREHEMRPDAPPELGVLGDRAGLVEEADVSLPIVPALEPVGDPAAREHAGEDLGAGGVKVAVDALDERGAGREREQLGQVVAERARDPHRSVGAVDPDMHVQAERVVAPDHVAEELVVAAVVRRVDDPLLLPGAPGVRGDGRETDAEAVRERTQLRPALAQSVDRLGEGVATAGAHLDLGCDQLADEVRLELRAPRGPLELLEAVDEAERRRVEQRELLLH